MTQISIISGTGATETADFTDILPVNLEPIGLEQGISHGYLSSAMGSTTVATGPGIDRGGISWNDVHYRVMGTKLVSISQAGAVTVLADVGGSGPVSLDYGFDRLAIRSGTNLYYWDRTALTQVTDPDLGPCVDVVWMDGYFCSTDGTSIVVTDLSDPTSVNPLKYGSAEADPDMVTGLLHLRDELVALGKNTIEFYTDAGGSGFPFAVNTGATIPIGCVGPQAKCIYSQTFAFVGSGRNHATSVWLAGSGTAIKLSTRLVDDLLASVADQSSIALEARVSRHEERLYVHLPNMTLVYLFQASQTANQPVWYICASGRGADQTYRQRNAVLCYGNFYVGDTGSSKIGKISDSTGLHFDDPTGWRFTTSFNYNGAKSFIMHTLELIGLPGRGVTNPAGATATLEYSLDGETWSLPRVQAIGKSGQRNKRCQWSPHKRARNYMALRFTGDSDGLVGWAALEAETEALSS